MGAFFFSRFQSIILLSQSVSVVNRPTTNRRLIDGQPADRPTSLSKINRQTDHKRPGLLDVNLVGNFLGRLSCRAISEILYFASLKLGLYTMLVCYTYIAANRTRHP